MSLKTILNLTDPTRHSRLSEAATREEKSLAGLLRHIVDLYLTYSTPDESNLTQWPQEKVDYWTTPAMILRNEVIFVVNQALLDSLHYKREDIVGRYALSLFEENEQAGKRYKLLGFKPGLYLLNAGAVYNWYCGNGTRKKFRVITATRRFDDDLIMELVRMTSV